VGVEMLELVVVSLQRDEHRLHARDQLVHGLRPFPHLAHIPLLRPQGSVIAL
jgi:hypothetical protein